MTDKRRMWLEGSNLCFVLTRRGRQTAELWDACVVRGGGSENEGECSRCESVCEDGGARGGSDRVRVDKEFWRFRCFCCIIVREEEIHQSGVKCTHCRVV